jgi:heterodisulfide reductase subunit A
MIMPRIGVFICHCGKNIAGAVEVKELVQFAKDQPDVVYTKDNKFQCSEQGQEQIQKAINKYKLERVVVTACGADLHGETFKSVLLDVGLEPEYLAMADIRKFTMGKLAKNNTPEQIKGKCEKELSRTIKRLRLKKVPKKVEVSLKQSVLVLGGGISGLEAALELGNKGYKVFLVERKPVLGGAMALLYKVYPTDDCASCILAPKLAQVMSHKNIHVFTQTEQTEFNGLIGNFNATLYQQPMYVDHDKCTGCGACQKVCPVDITDSEYQYTLGNRKAIYIPYPQAVPHKAVLDFDNCTKCGDCIPACPHEAISLDEAGSDVELSVGAVIVATGFTEFNADSIKALGYKKYPDILTQRQLIRLLDIDGPTKGQLLKLSTGKPPQNIVMLQCVGSRDKTTNISCSGGVCCMAALKHAQLIKHEYPNTNVYISMLDMRAYGKGFEEYYQQAMDAGVKFIRGRFAEIVEIAKINQNKKSDSAGLLVSVEDMTIDELVQIPADLVVLSTAMVPPRDNTELGKLLGIKIGADGFFQEAHMKLRPVETNVRGVYIAGACRGPTDIPTSIIQAKAAASEADNELRRKRIRLPENMVKQFEFKQ